MLQMIRKFVNKRKVLFDFVKYVLNIISSIPDTYLCAI